MKEFNVASDSIDWDEVRDRYTMQILEDSTSRETKYKKNEHERRKLSSLHSESLNQITSSNYKVKKKRRKERQQNLRSMRVILVEKESLKRMSRNRKSRSVLSKNQTTKVIFRRER